MSASEFFISLCGGLAALGVGALALFIGWVVLAAAEAAIHKIRWWTRNWRKNG